MHVLMNIDIVQITVKSYIFVENYCMILIFVHSTVMPDIIEHFNFRTLHYYTQYY